jgi:hypothetical protein
MAKARILDFTSDKFQVINERSKTKVFLLLNQVPRHEDVW